MKTLESLRKELPL